MALHRYHASSGKGSGSLMSSMNKVIIIGNLGKDPEVRQTKDGRSVANLTVATSDKWKDKRSGEMQEKTEWHRVVVFNEHICKYVEKYAKKGAKVALVGKLTTRKWVDQKGEDRYTTEIELGAFNSELIIVSGGSGASTATNTAGEGGTGGVAEKQEVDDEIPF